MLEYAAPVFTSMLTQKNKSDIERIQKIVFRILLGDKYTSYTQACVSFNTISLEQRREHLSLKFALSCLENPQHRNLFKQQKHLTMNWEISNHLRFPSVIVLDTTTHQFHI